MKRSGDISIRTRPDLPQRDWRRRILHYDRGRRRVWLADQRVHHGLTGALIATTGLFGLASRRLSMIGTLEITALGAALMADDWHDRAVWFTRERAPAEQAT